MDCAVVCVSVCVSIFGSLTVDSEGDGSTQVSFQIVEICGCALVHAVVSALDRFQNQETTLTTDGFVLNIEWQVLQVAKVKKNKQTNIQLAYTHEMHTYIFSEVKLRLRVSVSLTRHGNSVALFDWISVEQGKSCLLRGIWMDKNRH